MLNKTITSCDAFSTTFYQEFVTNQVIVEKLFWSCNLLALMAFSVMLVAGSFPF